MIYTVLVRQTCPLGRRGAKVQVSDETPHIDRWLDTGVVELVDEEVADDALEGEGDPADEPGGGGLPGEGRLEDDDEEGR